MPASAIIILSKAETPINTPVTKLGGQPVWLEKPQWPLSRELGLPMGFLGQVALADVPSLPKDLQTSGRVAYIFMTTSEEAVSTWEPDGGENAVVIQPGGGAVTVAVEERATLADLEHPECVVRLTPQAEPEFAWEEPGQPGISSDKVGQAEWETLNRNKLGGTPCFIQYVEYPPNGGPWHPILQLHDYNEFPGGVFDPNFGSGQAHVFVSEDGREGRMLWQC